MEYERQKSKLKNLGWDDFFAEQLSDSERADAVIARVVEPARGLSRVAWAEGEIWGESTENLGVGDWVVGHLRKANETDSRLSINRILTRRTKLSRQAPSGRNHEQILCANAQTVFVVVAMNQFLHLPGVTRALEAAAAGGLGSAIVLTKADVCADSETVFNEVQKVAKGVPVFGVSVATRSGLSALEGYFRPGETIVLLGASGAGKSTLTNYFIGNDIQVVSETRDRDEKGRHTTTARRLHFLTNGAMLVDSPGIRELQPWVEPVAKAKSPKPKGPRAPRSTRHYLDDEDS